MKRFFIGSALLLIILGFVCADDQNNNELTVNVKGIEGSINVSITIRCLYLHFKAREGTK